MNIERAMEFLLEQQAASQARADAQMAEIRQTLAETNKTLAETNQTLAETVANGRRTRSYLDRAIQASVKEAREERRRRRLADDKLAAEHENIRQSQEALRKSIQAYFDRLTGTNGHDQQ